MTSLATFWILLVSIKNNFPSNWRIYLVISVSSLPRSVWEFPFHLFHLFIVQFLQACILQTAHHGFLQVAQCWSWLCTVLEFCWIRLDFPLTWGSRFHRYTNVCINISRCCEASLVKSFFYCMDCCANCRQAHCAQSSSSTLRGYQECLNLEISSSTIIVDTPT